MIFLFLGAAILVLLAYFVMRIAIAAAFTFPLGVVLLLIIAGMLIASR
jgi:hypothetical protein